MIRQQQWTLGLMASSLIALLLFLGFWLRGSFQEAAEVMHKEGNLLYQESVSQVQDSMFKDFIEVFVQRAQSGTGNYFMDSLTNQRDSLTFGLRFDRTESLTRRRVATEFSSSDTTRGETMLTIRVDSVSDVKDTLIYLEHLERVENALEWEKDPEVTEVLIQHFEARLAKAELPQSYELRSITEVSDTTEWSFFPHSFVPYQREEVVFTGYSGYILKRISGQIFFSAFLFLLTTLAFWSLYRSNRRALQYTQLKSDFISNMTHELKTPITTVGVAVEAVKGFVDQHDWEKMKEYLDISEHELGRLSLLVDKVLKLSVLEQGVPSLKKESIDLQDITCQVMDAMKIQVEQQGGSFDLVTEGQDFSMKGDAVHLTNVLFNLLENSLKYTERPPLIKIDLQAEDRQLIIRVQDNGIGIPADYQEKVFERFFRVPQGDQHDVKGYGLGLSYVADIVKQHGGDIHLSSKPGEGSVFTLKFPRGHE